MPVRRVFLRNFKYITAGKMNFMPVLLSYDCIPHEENQFQCSLHEDSMNLHKEWNSL